MSQAMREVRIDESLQRRLHDAFFKTADWMRNR
jgi:hypothetical protein